MPLGSSLVVTVDHPSDIPSSRFIGTDTDRCLSDEPISSGPMTLSPQHGVSEIDDRIQHAGTASRDTGT